MKALNFPNYEFEIKIQEQKNVIFDSVRKKFIPLTPEEWVRQHCISHLIYSLNIPSNNIAVEREIKTLNLRKRFDIVAFAKNGSPLILVECKSTDVSLTMETLIQAGIYNKKIDSKYLWITNGLEHVWLEKKLENFMPIPFPEKIER